MAKSAFRRFSQKLLADGFVFANTPKIGIKVINKTGSAISADKLVAITGFDVTTKRPKIVLADSDLGTQYDFYVTDAAIPDGTKGVVYKGAQSASNLDTSGAATVGDPVYLSGTAGAFVHTADFTKSVVPVGFVTVKSSTVGAIYWQLPQGMLASGIQDTVVATQNVIAGAANADFDGRFFIADRAYEIVAVREQHQTLGTDGAAVTLMVKKVPSGTARASGTDTLAAGINMKATIDTVQSPALHATATNYQLAAGDSLATVLTGTGTSLDGVTVTVFLKKI